MKCPLSEIRSVTKFHISSVKSLDLSNHFMRNDVEKLYATTPDVLAMEIKAVLNVTHYDITEFNILEFLIQPTAIRFNK